MIAVFFDAVSEENDMFKPLRQCRMMEETEYAILKVVEIASYISKFSKNSEAQISGAKLFINEKKHNLGKYGFVMGLQM